MSVPVWNSHKCLVCGKYHPEWQMMPISLDTGRVKQFKMGYTCKNKKCSDIEAITKALEAGRDRIE